MSVKIGFVLIKFHLLVFCNIFCYGYSIDNLDLKQKQIFVFKLLNHITEPTIYQDVLAISNDFKFEENLDSFAKTEYVKEFAKSFQKGQSFPRGEIFCLFCEKQLKEAMRTFLVLYYANNFTVFLKTSCWLRQNVNEGLFAYAFSVAVRHRDDCRSVILPSVYEVYPFLFVSQSTIQKASMVKMEMGCVDDELKTYYEIDKFGNEVQIADKSEFYVNEDDKLFYFKRDTGLNTYYYDFHIDYPFWMGDEIYGLTTDRRGELYIYIHRQLLARYYLERLSNHLCDIEAFEPSYAIEPGFHPAIKFQNGWVLPDRPNNYKINKDKTKILKEINNFQYRVRDAIVNGFILSYDGAKTDMKKSQGIEVLGRRIYGNLDKSDRDFLYFYDLMTRDLLSTTLSNDGIHLPTSTLQFYETALHDPVFWQVQKSTMDAVDKFDLIRSPHRRDDLFFAGVKISNVAVGKLVTYFEENNIDITNAVPMNAEEIDLGTETLKIFAKKVRLNHASFDVVIDVQSDKAISCVVRMYLGPKEDCYGNIISIENNRHNFVELDTFLHQLNVGNNTIIRNSNMLNNVIGDRELTRDLWKQYENKQVVNITNFLYRHSGFPSNLVLPKGSKGGKVFTLFVMISPFDKQRTYAGFNVEEVRAKKLCRFNLCVHSVPLGFPFNKEVDREILSFPNSRFVDVIIFHKLKKDFEDNLAVVHNFA